MSILSESFEELYGIAPDYQLSVRYTNKFKPYNANVKLRGNNLQFNLSKRWKSVSREIRIGLIQELMLKILKNRLKPVKTKTQNMELYNIFMKKIHIAAPKTSIDPVLEASFDRVNGKYFYNILDKTNLVWGNYTTSKLGSYEYGSDTITISRVLQNAEQELLDYIMYHEMLHKKHKFTKKNNRSYHHTSKFRKDEKDFENSEEIEKKLKRLLVRKRFSLRNIFRGIL